MPVGKDPGALHRNDYERSNPLTPQWSNYDDEQIEAAVRVLQSANTNYWSGTECQEFEAEFARYIDVPHAISLANGTVALELALIGLGIAPGDEVIVPCSSFIATASAVVACGAVPVFADVDSQTQTLTADTLQSCLSARTRAVIVVHLYGLVCQMEPIIELARRHDLRVIEDCAQAHGARYHGNCVGSLGDAAAFSFCQDKIISTGGEGGMLLCRSSAVWAKAWSYKDHGKQPSSRDVVRGSAYRWIHETPGTNWRMTEFQAAIGRVQLRRLTGWVERRQQIAALFRQQLADLSVLQLPDVATGTSPAWYRFPMRLHRGLLTSGWNRDRVVSTLVEQGIACGAGVCPELYREQALERFAPNSRAPNARELADFSWCLSMHHSMTDAQVNEISKTIRSVLLLSTL